MLKMTMRASGFFRQNFLRQLEPRHARQIDVHQRDVRLPREKSRETLFGVGGLDHFDVVLAREQRLAAGEHDGMIVDDQDAHENPLSLKTSRLRLTCGTACRTLARSL